MIFIANVDDVETFISEWNRDDNEGPKLVEHGPGCWSVGALLVTVKNIGAGLVRYEVRRCRGWAYDAATEEMLVLLRDHGLRVFFGELDRRKYPPGEMNRIASQVLWRMGTPRLSSDGRTVEIIPPGPLPTLDEAVIGFLGKYAAVSRDETGQMVNAPKGRPGSRDYDWAFRQIMSGRSEDDVYSEYEARVGKDKLDLLADARGAFHKTIENRKSKERKRK